MGAWDWELMSGKNNLAIEFFVICWQECLMFGNKGFLLGQSQEFFFYTSSHHRSCAYVACRMANHIYLFLYNGFINSASISTKDIHSQKDTRTLRHLNKEENTQPKK